MQLCDVTLREGNQMPGRDYSVTQRVAAGDALDRLGIAFLQAGFPVTGESDRETVSQLADRSDADIVALARARSDDVTAALDADADVVEVMAPLSDRQLEHTLDEHYETVLRMLRDAVGQARDGGATAHVTLVDAFRTDLDRVVHAFEVFPDVPYINLADTVGARTPQSVRSVLDQLREHVDLSRVGVHFHDDMGVATANVLASYAAGVGKADVSVASLGERAGNPALEEVVVAGTTELDESFGVTPSAVIPVCNEVLDELEESIEPRKAVLGREVTEHESGIHTAAMLDEPATFEPFAPEDFGGDRRLVFGAGTGRAGARKLLERAGVSPTDERISQFLDVLAERGPLETDQAVALATEQFA